MTTDIESLRELYVDQLKDLYSAEHLITTTLPQLIKKVTSTELKRTLEEHLQETIVQLQRLDQVFEALEQNPRGKRCAGIEGVLEDGRGVMATSSDLMDAALISECQKLEHYEISAYGTARAFADLLGEYEAVELLTLTLDEEKTVEQKLARLGVNVINLDALQEDVFQEMI